MKYNTAEKKLSEILN